MTPLERAIALLKNKGYRTVQQPFGIGTATYSFDAVLTAEQSLDLVLLQDTTLGSGERIRREVLAFGRSLDVLGSRRTLTPQFWSDSPSTRNPRITVAGMPCPSGWPPRG